MELDNSREALGGGFVLVRWVGVEDVDEEISVFDSNHCLKICDCF